MQTHDTSTSTIKGTINRISAVNKIPNKCVPRSVAVRYRQQCLYTGVENYDVNWGKLDEWGQQFVERKPGSKFDLCMDEQGRFTQRYLAILQGILLVWGCRYFSPRFRTFL